MPHDLHLALQQHYAGPDGLTEAPLRRGGRQARRYRADAVRDGIIYEIQTGSFTAIRPKLERLTRQQRVVLVCPLAAQKLIVHVDDSGRELRTRRSPKHARLVDIFDQLLHLTDLLSRKRLELEIVLTSERELRRDDGAGSWRRRGVSLVGRQLVEILSLHRFAQPADFLSLLPEALPAQFTTRDLSDGCSIPRRLAQRMAYALRRMSLISAVGKTGNAIVYKIVSP